MWRGANQLFEIRMGWKKVFMMSGMIIYKKCKIFIHIYQHQFLHYIIKSRILATHMHFS